MNARNKSGFTLIEMMVVAILVAIMAAVAFPLMTANKKRAMATEADAGCGAVRMAMRVYFADQGVYPLGGPASTVPGVGSNDLDGVYFSTPDYQVTIGVQGSTYWITATGNSAGSTALQKAKVAGVTVTLDQNGVFTRTGL